MGSPFKTGPLKPPKRTLSWRRQRIYMPCASWLNATLPPPWSWPKPIGCASHWATFRAPCHTNLERAVGGMQGASAEMPPHTPSAIKHICILHLAKIIYYTSNSHPSTNTFVNTTKWNSKKKSNIAPKKKKNFPQKKKKKKKKKS